MPSAERGLVRFGGDAFDAPARLIRREDRGVWAELSQLRQLADERIEAERLRAIDQAVGALSTANQSVLDERLALMAQAFNEEAAAVDQEVLELAIRIATKVVRVSDPQAFFDRAAETLATLRDADAPVRIRVHPEAIARLPGLAQQLGAASGSVRVSADPTLPSPLSLIVETRRGQIDLDSGVQLRRIANALKDADAAREGPTTP